MEHISSASSFGGDMKEAVQTQHGEVAPQTSNENKRAFSCEHFESAGEYVLIEGRILRKGDANIFLEDLTPATHKELPKQVGFANPLPLGLASFSFMCLTLGLVNARVRGVTNLYLLNASFIFCGAVVLLSGLLSFCVGDTFCMTVFGSFGGFWISWGCLNIEQFGVTKAYADDPQALQNILGFYLAGWTVFNFLVMVCSMKSTWGIFLLLFFLDLTFLMLCIGSFTQSVNASMAGGYFGILSSCCGWYSLYCSIANKDSSYVPLVAYPMPGSQIV
ncbi:AHL_G0006650.mRNA.1.CDS.1 [Saccharomyces cerevisiae]|nr:AHL_G0006650.mRNA.1.CDS.1 [Saccharomyces cerevisiae]CAI6527688.1 AHL_G0006650.mRNA.1.CDS.1 [Saccharomyces cerevisiae]